MEAKGKGRWGGTPLPYTCPNTIKKPAKVRKKGSPSRIELRARVSIPVLSGFTAPTAVSL